MGRDDGVSIRLLMNMNPAYARERMDGIPELARSIQDHGMIFPIITTADYVIVDGARRLEALKLLRETTARVIATDDYETLLTKVAEAQEFRSPHIPEPVPFKWLEVGYLRMVVLSASEYRHRAKLVAANRSGDYRARERPGYSNTLLLAARAFGVRPTEIQGAVRLHGLVAKFPADEQAALKEELLLAQADGISPQTVASRLFDRLNGNENKRSNAKYAGRPPVRYVRTVPAQEQIKITKKISEQIAVCSENLAEIFPGVHPDMTAEQSDELQKTIRAATRRATEIANMLRAYTRKQSTREEGSSDDDE